MLIFCSHQSFQGAIVRTNPVIPKYWLKSIKSFTKPQTQIQMGIKNLKGCLYFEAPFIPFKLSFNSNIKAEIFVLRQRIQMFKVHPTNLENFFKIKDQYVKSYGSKFVKAQITLNMLNSHSFKANLNLYRKNDSFLNVTGISSYKEFMICKSEIENWIQSRSIKAIVDCIFISQKRNLGGLNPTKMFEILKRNPRFFTSYEPEIFSGIVMVPYRKRTLPSLLIFSSGTIQLIAGADSFRKILSTIMVG